ncbi:hypothetical protein BVY04_03810 [bacterium M21]|nr:hypothetical protein BVY04_03810 [bacterium M21]
MKRTATDTLLTWKDSSHRKPLVLRGARQVGKTMLVREFGKSFELYVEFNFDETPDKESMFEGRPIEEVIRLIEVEVGAKLIPDQTLLFFDEVQAAPSVLPLLRYFYEKRPDIHVIAAGSLLEFLLADHSFSMPVGRIEYCFLTPLRFEEFICGGGQESMLGFLKSFDFSETIPEAIHAKFARLLQTYYLVGGMPEAAARWFETEDFLEVQRVHAGILQTYQDDFSKYGRRVDPNCLRTTLRAIPGLVGEKVKYTNLDPHAKPAALNQAIRALGAAGLISQIFHTAGNGVPLGSEMNERRFKAIFLDIGLYATSMSMRLLDLHQAGSLMLVNSGAFAEQYIGQALLNLKPAWVRPELFYWHREKRASNAEVDYITNQGATVLPIEVKAGKTGSLRSLHTFMAEKGGELGLRFNMDQPSWTTVTTEVAKVGRAEYQLLSLPLYLVGQSERLLSSGPR